MISYQHQCIFIHIPKTAGSSIEQKLGHFTHLERGVQDHAPIKVFQPFTLAELGKIKQKYDLPYILAYKIKFLFEKAPHLSPQQYQNYFKFAFVRNPWARVFSWYKNVMRDDVHLQRLGVSNNISFKEFVTNHLDQPDLRPQLFWLVDRQGQIPLDFIGRFEKLNEDFAHICKVLNLDDPALPHLLKSGNPTYVNAYDEAMIQRVAKKYAEEIAMFDYTFGS